LDVISRILQEYYVKMAKAWLLSMCFIKFKKETYKFLKKTKIVCTIGPVTESVETLKELLNRGMNVMRLNFSHGDYEEHGTRIKNFRQAMSETGKRAGLLLDTKGPEIRTMSLEDGKDVSIKAGQKFTFTTDQSVVGNSERVAVTYPDFAKDLKVGDMILVDDGLIELDVTEIKGNEVIAKIDANSEIINYLYSTGETLLTVNDSTGETEFFFKNGNTFMKGKEGGSILNYRDGKPLYEIDGDSETIYNEEGDKIVGGFDLVTDIKKLD